MLQLSFQTLRLQKLHPLAISRGSMSFSDNLFVSVSDGKHTGIGELSPSTSSEWTAERGEKQLAQFWQTHASDSPHQTWQAMRDAGIDPPAIAALDIALWDLLAKRASMPLFKLLGLTNKAVATSVTVGLNPPEVTKERVPHILRTTGARNLKIKLGSPEGLEFDKAHFSAASEAAKPFGAGLRVDANGGWSVDDALSMMAWLAERSVDYVEQPLPKGMEGELPRIFGNRPLPIYVDESCCWSTDIPNLADRADGVNLKLMKCGGVTEALRIVAAARASGLKTMIGCMSESSIAISAGAALGCLFDHIDLDSQLNLNPDPATGAPMVDGVVTPTDKPGHGAELA